MKKIIFNLALVCGLAMLTTSCEDFLEEDPRTSSGDTSLYETPAGLKGLTDACYTYTRFWYGKEPGIALTEGGTDLFLMAADNRTRGLCTYGTVGHLSAATSGNSNENPALDEYWEVFFAAISVCNTAIQYAQEADFADAKQYLGEASFLRAFYYWHVVETWGPAPINREPSIMTAPVRNSEAEIYDFMLEDVDRAIELLGEKTIKNGRVNVWAAKAFKARLLLYLASEHEGGNYEGGVAQAYADAATIAQEVITGSGCSLYGDAKEIWNQAHEDFVRNDEVIWGVEYDTNLANNKMPLRLAVDEENKNKEWTQMLIRSNDNSIGGNASHLMFTGLWDKSRLGMAGLGASNVQLFVRTDAVDKTLPADPSVILNPYYQTYSKGFNRFAPSGHLLDLFVEGDQRYQASFRDAYQIPPQFVAKKMTSNAKSYFEATATPSDTVIYLSKNRMLTEKELANFSPKKYVFGTRFEGAGAPVASGTSRYPMYTNIEGDELTGPMGLGSGDGVLYGTQLYIALKKFDDYGTGGQVIRDLSPRDVFVFRLAEMYLIKAEAALYGAGGSIEGELQPLLDARGASGLYSYSTIEDILDERGREFAGEQIRWFDLKRTGNLTAAYLTGKNKLAAEGIQPFHKLRPIPQVQMDAVTNKSEFLQNTGY